MRLQLFHYLYLAGSAAFFAGTSLQQPGFHLLGSVLLAIATLLSARLTDPAEADTSKASCGGGCCCWRPTSQ